MEREKLIVQIINQNPGIRYSELSRQSGLKNGVLSHYLSKFEQNGKIIVERTPRVARLYPVGMPEEETKIIKFLKNPTGRKILNALYVREMTFKEIVQNVEKTQGTVSICLKNLCNEGIIQKSFGKGSIIFKITNKSLLDKLLPTPKSSLVEAADNIADIFSSI